jgi:MraZ protein
MGKNGIIERFRGSFVAKIDDRSRVKIPSQYLFVLEKRYGRAVYLTSLNGTHILLYPLAVWEAVESRIEQINVRDPDLEEYLSRISYWGSESDIDQRGRVLIPPNLKASCHMVDQVLILGKVDYLVLWNKELFETKYLQGTFNDERMARVSRIIHEFSSLPGDEQRSGGNIS